MSPVQCLKFNMTVSLPLLLAASCVVSCVTGRWDVLETHVPTDPNLYPVKAFVLGTDIYYTGFFTNFDSSASATGIVKYSTLNRTYSALKPDFQYIIVVKAVGSDIFAGGNFRTRDTTGPCNGIAKWNGAAWSCLGTGLSIANKERDSDIVTVNAIAQVGTDVYVAGMFDTAGGVAVANVAIWSTATSTWRALNNVPAVVNMTYDREVRAMDAAGDTVAFVVLAPSYSGNTWVCIHNTTNSTWVTFATGQPNTVAVAIGGGYVYTNVATTAVPVDIDIPLLARYSLASRNWSSVGTLPSIWNGVFTLAVYDCALFAGVSSKDNGNQLFEHCVLGRD